VIFVKLHERKIKTFKARDTLQISMNKKNWMHFQTKRKTKANKVSKLTITSWFSSEKELYVEIFAHYHRFCKKIDRDFWWFQKLYEGIYNTKMEILRIIDTCFV